MAISWDRLSGRLAGDVSDRPKLDSDGQTMTEHWYFQVILWAAAIFALIRHDLNVMLLMLDLLDACFIWLNSVHCFVVKESESKLSIGIPEV